MNLRCRSNYHWCKAEFSAKKRKAARTLISAGTACVLICVPLKVSTKKYSVFVKTIFSFAKTALSKYASFWSFLATYEWIPTQRCLIWCHLTVIHHLVIVHKHKWNTLGKCAAFTKYCWIIRNRKITIWRTHTVFTLTILWEWHDALAKKNICVSVRIKMSTLHMTSCTHPVPSQR